MSGARTAVITGASSGIGLELAKLFARDGYHVAVVARDAQALEALAGELRRQFNASVSVIVQDLARPGASEELARAVAANCPPVEALVNNAGFGTYGPFAASDLISQLEMLQVNVVALTHLTRLLLPGMIERKAGRVLNVASTAAFQPGPLMAVYYASKAYVLSFSEAIANELQGTGVSVTVLCPGPTQTKFQKRAGVEHTRLMSRGVMDAGVVALAGYQGMQRGKPLVIPGLRNRVVAFAGRLLPRQVVVRVVRRIQESRSDG